LRKEFVHPGILNEKFFVEANLADEAIDVSRRAIKAIYAHTGSIVPQWVDDEYDRGFEEETKSFGVLQVGESNANLNDPNTVRNSFVYKDRKYICNYYLSGTEHGPLLTDLVRRMRLPISIVRAYWGNELLEEREVSMRGN
jgi:hypothetical protein